ncbi:unnamed protein product [Rotaria magnacalcarata]|uniref:Uncharacterized protein n=1 Tax=Rotaria magnacalcarata TaxID=392030 RepID=A0A816P9T4_9BILA|nr:unnamed protein product [Rotaria magnacalcarata]CAF4102427.1 unnamed protein product [Rotaria magnacalcarata]
MATGIVITQQALYNTGLFKEWSHEAFNNLNDIGVSQHASLGTVAQEMGKDLREIDLHSYIGVCRIHNHFKLNSEEVVELSFGSCLNDRLTKVQSSAGVAYLNPVQVKGGSETAPIPYMWAFDKVTRLFFPVQFFDGSNVIMRQRFVEIVTEKRDQLVDFLSRFIDRVSTNSVEDDMGFYIRYDNLISRQAGETLVEDTCVEDRQQWILPITKAAMQQSLAEKRKTHPTAFTSQTHWYFDDNSCVGTVDCSGHCIAHRY